MAEKIQITFHGHSAFEIRRGDATLLIDPFISDNPVSTVSAAELNPTHIILTHGHGDHLGDTIDIARRSGAEVITTFEVANYLKEQGLENVADLGVGGGRDFSFGRIVLTIAHHGSQAPDGTYMGAPAGALILLGNRVIYHAGDTALTYDMKLIAERYNVDVAMVPIGDNYTMDVEDGARAIDFVDADVAIPMHYNTFDVVKADPEEFRSRVEAGGRKAVILQPGESFELDVNG